MAGAVLIVSGGQSEAAIARASSVTSAAADRYLASAGRASNGLPLLSTDWDISPTCVVKCGRPQVRAPQPRVMRSLRMRWPWQADRVLHLPPHNTIIQLIKSYPPNDMRALT